MLGPHAGDCKTSISRLKQSVVSHSFRSFDNLVDRRPTRRPDRPSPACTRSRSDRSEVEHELNVWYFDDATIGGSPESVISDVQRCISGLKRMGLIVNPKKTEIINVGLAAGKFSRVVNSFSELLPDIKLTELTKMELVGSPILADATICCIVKKLSEHKGMNDRILLLDGYPGLFLLKNAFSRASCLPSGLRYVFTTKTPGRIRRNHAFDD